MYIGELDPLPLLKIIRAYETHLLGGEELTGGPRSAILGVQDALERIMKEGTEKPVIISGSRIIYEGDTGAGNLYFYIQGKQVSASFEITEYPNLRKDPNQDIDVRASAIKSVVAGFNRELATILEFEAPNRYATDDRNTRRALRIFWEETMKSLMFWKRTPSQ